MALSRRAALLAGAAFSLAPVSSALAVTAPRLGSVQLVRPPDPYDPGQDADTAIARAQARARKAGKLMLIDMGGNWCGDCLVLTAVMNLPAAKAFIDRRFEIVTVDVGQFDKNLQVPARYKVALKAVPCVVVIDAKGQCREPAARSWPWAAPPRSARRPCSTNSPPGPRAR